MSDDTSQPLMQLSVIDGVATIRLDSQANRNALSSVMLGALHDALDRATKSDIRTIVLTHSGPVFCSGIDLKERATGSFDSAPMAAVFERLMTCDQVTIAALKGAVRAGGVGLMASCDLVVVDQSVTFAFTEVRIGVAPAMIAVPILRRVNATRLAAPFLTGESFDVWTALDMGLVTHVRDDVDGEVERLCAAVQAGAPGAVAATKRILREVPGVPVGEGLALMRQRSDELFATEEAAEGMAAFLAKRPPSWA